MNLTALALKFNRVTYTLLLMSITLGIVSYRNLPRDSMPPYTVRVASVVTNFPGASPERVELLITDKIEKVAQEIPEVETISSTSRTGLSVVNVELKDEVPAVKLQAIWDRLRRKIELIQADLPEGIYGPIVKDEDIGVVYGIIVGLKSDGFEYKELKEYAEDLRDELIRLEDAAKVEIGGIIEERIFVDFNNSELAKLGLSSNQLKSIISSTNIIIPAGEVNLGEERIILEPSGNLEAIEDIRNMLIPLGNSGETIPLGEITNVNWGYITPRESLVKINGEEAIALYISLIEGANIVQLGEEVDKLLLDHNQYLPVGLTAQRVASQDLDVNKNVNDFINNVFQSIVIVLLVMFLFLGVRTGVVVASLIPAAIIMTLLLMNQALIGLNQVSLAALIMALGMLVDNAIVMAESMMVKMEQGESGIDAAIAASKELMVPLLISSLTTSAAFLAFFLAESVMGEIMGPLFSVITLALLSSWLMALTIVPLLAVVIIKVKKQEGTPKPSLFDKLNIYYNHLLDMVLKRPLLVLFSIIALFVLSVFGFGFLPFVFMPDSERNLVTLDLNLPLGTNIESTQENIAKLEQFIKDSLLIHEERSKGIIDWSSFIGIGPNSYDLGYSPGEQNSGYAHLLINTSSGDDNDEVIRSLEHFCFAQLPDAQVTVKKLGSGGGASTPVQIRITGANPDELSLLKTQIKNQLIQTPGTKNVDDDWGPKIKKFLIQIDQARLRRSSLTNQDIAVSLSTVLSGYTVGEFRKEDNSIPIAMREEGSQSIHYENIESLNIFSQSTGNNVPLAQVATLLPRWEYSKILRRDLKRTVTVESQLQEGFTASEITSAIKPWLEQQSHSWKRGYSYEFGGEAESSSKAMDAVVEKLPLSFFIILFLLILQFNSVRKTIVVVSTIPLGLIGVVGGLLLANSYFSFTGFLGLISLAGIVINNAIVLLDRIQIELTEFNRPPVEAIKQAANERFRPILLTTFTTSLGLIPLWLGGGIMWEPMAIGIIFGLLFATVITLLFVPLMYKLLFGVKKA
ncbi:efflux RND transporter permease subunit [Rapidithrix thailandica]|uniref:Efflux RND transporter permease subunit n=1 Tax=Rapidithrix thailandica TaxID=413964 RepID=A0AAW9S1U8_9BACT